MWAKFRLLRRAPRTYDRPMLRTRSLAALFATAALVAVSASPAAAAQARPPAVPQCVEELFYTYVTEPQEPWTPARCVSRA
jgi:hypothetical protein